MYYVILPLQMLRMSLKWHFMQFLNCTRKAVMCAQDDCATQLHNSKLRFDSSKETRHLSLMMHL